MSSSYPPHVTHGVAANMGRSLRQIEKSSAAMMIERANELRIKSGQLSVPGMRISVASAPISDYDQVFLLSTVYMAIFQLNSSYLVF